MKLPVLTTLAALGTAALALGAWSFRVRDLDVRGTPWRVPLGPVVAGAPLGESFTAVRDGLERVDIAAADVTDQPAEEVELVLRAEGPAGDELRRVRAARIESMAQGAWLVFEFEPVADSAGRRFHAEFGPAPGVELCHYAPFVRFRGFDDWGEPWGERAFAGPRVEGEFLSHFDTLRGLAFGGEQLGGSAELVLFDAEGAEVRRASVENPASVEWGWLVFGFEPIEASRWRTWRYELALSPTATLRGTEAGPARTGFYGGGAVDEHLHGLTRGGALFADRDLGLRTWSERGPGVAWALLRERLGGRVLLAAGLLALAAALLGAAVGALAPEAEP
ncbi:MAG TPA: hypothetical protein VMT18_03365 [Planctomycetota bacterium]|nr:hypothetical protein [Planctomycetota bacterium]